MASQIVDVIYRIQDLASAGIKKIKQALNETGQASIEASKSVDSFSNRINKSGVEAGITAAALGLVSAALLGLGKSLVQSSIYMEQQTVSFEVMLGSAEAAREKLEELKAFAEKTPFQFTDVVEYSKRLIAVGVSADNLIPIMKTLGDISAALGKEKLPFITHALQDVIAKGRLSGEELRQFRNNSVPLGFALQEVFGKSAAEIEKMAEAGQIGASDVVKALESMTSEGGRFYKMQERQAQTLGGKLSNLADSIGYLKTGFGDQLAPIVGFVAEKVKVFVDYLKDLSPTTKAAIGYLGIAVTVFTSLGAALLGIAIAAPAAAAGLSLIGLSIPGLGAIAAAVTGVSVAVAWMVNNKETILKFYKENETAIKNLGMTATAVLAAFPGGQIVLVLGAIAYAFYELATDFDNYWGAIKQYWNAGVGYVAKKAKDFVSAIDLIVSAINKLPTGLPKINLKDTLQSLDEFIKKTKEAENAASKSRLSKPKTGGGAQSSTINPIDYSTISNSVKNDGSGGETETEKEVKRQVEATKKIFEAQEQLATDVRNLWIDSDKKLKDERLKSIESELADQRAKGTYTIEAARAMYAELLNSENMYVEDKKKIQEKLDELDRQRFEQQKYGQEYLYSNEQNYLKNLQLEREKGATADQQLIKIGLDAARVAGEQKLNLAQAVANGELNHFKKMIIAKVDAMAAEWSMAATGMLARSYGLDPAGWALIAASSAASAGIRSALDGIKLAEGGIVMPQPGGVRATVAEAGQPEAVIPLNTMKAEKMIGGSGAREVIILTDDGTQLAKGVYLKQTELIEQGRLGKRS